MSADSFPVPGDVADVPEHLRRAVAAAAGAAQFAGGSWHKTAVEAIRAYLKSLDLAELPPIPGGRYMLEGMDVRAVLDKVTP